MAPSATTTRADFDIEVGTRSPGYNLPQRIGSALVLPMLAMALMAFVAALVVGIIRADEVSSGASADTVAALQHLDAGLMFIGFAAVFAAISFAIARILGQFRAGGGELQEASGRSVQTLRMPTTAKAFLMLMAMAMMIILTAVVLHFAFALDVGSSASSLTQAEDRFVVLEAIRRIGVAMYLFAITLGLATIVRVLRFQSVRIRELAAEAPGR